MDELVRILEEVAGEGEAMGWELRHTGIVVAVTARSAERFGDAWDAFEEGWRIVDLLTAGEYVAGTVLMSVSSPRA